MNIGIYRGGVLNLTVKIKDSSQLVQKLNAEDICKIQFEVPDVADLAIGDYITVYDKRYTLNIVPNAKKLSNRQYQYDCLFESRQYELGKVMYLDSIQGGEFFLTGDLDFFVTQLVSNMNRAQSGWSKGTVKASTATKNLQFSNQNCLAVLQRLCTEYEVDFNINESKQITVDDIGQTQVYTFEYGKGKGLYNIARNYVDSKNIFTRLYPFGASKNIPANYRDYSSRLKIAAGYIENNLSKYGVIETSKNFEDIYPRFTGTITSVSTPFKFICNAIDFNLNDYLISGTSAKIHFNTGDLAGYEFELSAFNNTTKEVTLLASQQEKVMNNAGVLEPMILPNTTLKPAIGDAFVFIDITMPDSYITAAESELLAAATDYLAANSEPRVSYSIELDPLYMKQNAIAFTIGDYIHIIDTPLDIDRDVRVQGITRDIFNAYKWKVDLSDYAEPQKIQRAYADIEDVKRLITVNNLNDIAKAIMNWRSTDQVNNVAIAKRRNFITEPFAPYDIGDLWTNGTDLYKCKTARHTGEAFNVGDWELATIYDNTMSAYQAGLLSADLSGSIRLEDDSIALYDADFLKLYTELSMGAKGYGTLELRDYDQTKFLYVTPISIGYKSKTSAGSSLLFFDSYLNVNKPLMICPLSANPSAPSAGWAYYNTATNKLRVYNGSTWDEFLISIDDYGTGLDGDVTISGTTTMSKDMNYNNLTISATGNLVTNGWIVRIKGTLTIASGGTINCNGSAGGNGGATTGGGPGGSGAYSLGTKLHLTHPTAGTNGAANSGAGTANSNGGTAGSSTLTPDTRHPLAFRCGGGGAGGGSHGNLPTTPSNSTGPYCGAAGGNGGTATGSNSVLLSGGGGGGGGGICIVYAYAIANSGKIQANGGKGGNGVTSSSCYSGNGGGGGGGVAYLGYHTGTPGTVEANGGAAGTGGNGGGSGSNGLTLSVVI